MNLGRWLLEDTPATMVSMLVSRAARAFSSPIFMQQLRNANFADGKTIDIESPTDVELEALYDGCLFTYTDLGLYRLNAAPIHFKHFWRDPTTARAAVGCWRRSMT
jgi:hypothetical protein